MVSARTDRTAQASLLSRTRNSNSRVVNRSSQVVNSRKAKITATLFQSKGDDGETGELSRQIKSYESRALVDPFVNVYGVGTGSMAIISPDFNPYSIVKLPNESSALRQCIDAMVTNICSFGYRLEYIGEQGQEESSASAREKERIESLMEQPNGEYTVTELRERKRRDEETFGYAFYEIGRDNKGQIIFINHVPAHTVRMTAKLSELVATASYLKRDGKLLKIVTHRQYRRFVQQIGARLVYFKEFGDPRVIDPRTGLEDTTLTPDQGATEIYHFSLYSPGSTYGLPRWIGNLPAIMGTRESELTNLSFFRDNAIPAMAILVSGGALSDDTLANLEDHFTAARGRDSINRLLVLEATGDEDAANNEGKIPAPKLDIKPLVSERQTDGLFKEYEEGNEKKIRASFRLPPLFVGRSDDYSHATADASIVMADSQVFGPERNKEDDIWNALFLTQDGMPLQYWRIRTNPPRLVSADSVLTALDTLDDLGAMTPNIAIGIANELFDLALTPIDAEWGNYPFPLVMQLALNNNLSGMEDIMIIPDLLERGQQREDTIAEGRSSPDDAQQGAEQNNAPKKKPAKPKPDKTESAKPNPSPAESGPGDTQSAKHQARLRRAADKIAFHFRSVAERGNDIGRPLMYKRHRLRESRKPAQAE